MATSTSQVLTAIASNSVLFGVFMTIFFLFRLKLKRMYEPKSSYDLIDEEKKPEPLPRGLWQWFVPLLKKSDNFVIQEAGIDGYFFLRYLLLICAYCGVSLLYMFPIILTVNATDGKNEGGMDRLAYQNIKHHKGRYYAHVFCGWVFYWMFLFVIYRELYYYNSLRCAVLSSPRYGRKLSSRTVLFQTVPEQYLSEREFNKLFDGVKRIWIARGGKQLLEKRVAQREELVHKLETTAVKHIRKALKAVCKELKKRPGEPVVPDINFYIPPEKRPKGRFSPLEEGPKSKFKFLNPKVDTMEHIRSVLPDLDAEITKLQMNNINASPFNSVFVEFESQYQAQVAAQVVTHHGPLSMCPSHVGIAPGDVYWPNMRMFWWERLVRSIIAVSAACALAIFWSFPVAFVGMISNINYLTNKLHWLRFIYKLPRPLLGLLTSLAPTIALAWLMSFLPTFIRMMAQIQGAATSQLLDYFVQQSFFAFQLVQVFLVVTVTSAVTSTVTKIVQNPTDAMTLLASNLPKSSNFFISYILLQGMGVSSAILAQFIPLIFFYIIGPRSDTTPRKKYTRFTDLDTPGWGTAYPVYTNLAVITFSYAIISPLILLFATVGFFLLYVAWLYTLTYVQAEGADNRGMNYPRALFQTIVGLYLGQICLLGLFAVGKGWGPIVLQAIGLGVTVIVHLHLNYAFDHLMKYVPVDTMKPLNGKSDTPSFKNIYKDTGTNPEEEIKELPKFPLPKYQRKNSLPPMDLPTSDSSDKTIQYNPLPEESYQLSENKISWVPLLADGADGHVPPAPLYKRFFLPHIYLSFKNVKNKLPETYGIPDPETPETEEANADAYNYPAVTSACPSVWLPRDPFGFSKQLVEEFCDVVNISDENATITLDGEIEWQGGPPAAGPPQSSKQGGDDDSSEEYKFET
ncbi:probable RSN1-Overexpression rescues sro7/sop1 in NaCl [Zygosaccharomyces bailii ISA1307]|nr:probable RSN1-Overexpression rescues sro7/sop1 in NaCl [Zygosaccharomyces bailii ISA1307]